MINKLIKLLEALDYRLDNLMLTIASMNPFTLRKRLNHLMNQVVVLTLLRIKEDEKLASLKRQLAKARGKKA